MARELTSLTATNLKCIGADPQGFIRLARVNVIVGRNNSGKSSLLELVEAAVADKAEFSSNLFHAGQTPSVLIETTLDEDDIRRTFPGNTSGGAISGNHFEYGRNLIGARFTARLTRTPGQREFGGMRNPAKPEETYEHARSTAGEYLNRLCGLASRNPFQGKTYRRLAAERNISPEADTSGTSEIRPDGTGATNAIQQFLNKSSLPRDVVRVDLLSALNEIFNPDTVFDEIVCRQLPDARWEIFLSEKHKGLVALSQSGSGLKTVILTLCLLHLTPKLENKKPGDFILAFEELENNLHPALQRRLLSYLAHHAGVQDVGMFITTHSSVAIDLFNKDPDATIVHVTHNGKHSTCTQVRAFVETHGVLDDLDIRASDLLQANGIVWVEGPSDRVYINRWIQLWSDGQLREGNHYQCVFYGGRLLAHISADAPDAESGGVSILRINRNAFIVIDSDKRSEEDALNATKTRVLTEIESIGGGSWVTDGREIENHIPFDALKSWPELSAALEVPPKQYESLFDYLDSRVAGLGKKYLSQKAALAEKICGHMTKEHLKADLHTARQLDALASRIRTWNRLKEPTPPSP